MAVRKAKKKKGKPKPKQPRFFDSDASTDNISRYLAAADLVPAKFRGTDKFLDVVSWNIRWFDSKDPSRIDAITEVLEALNADLFVLTEIAADGALEDVVGRLGQRRAGFYSAFYGSTGSQQRVALMWDRDWLRTKEDPEELFGDEKLEMAAEFGTGRQKVFPRLPLWAYFEAFSADPGNEGFTFEVAGVHLKAQGPAPKGYKGKSKRWGVPQRTQAAQRLVQWLDDDSAHFDTDVIVIGDWNATPDQPEWKVIRDLEAQGSVHFSHINPKKDASHLVRLNQSGPAGTRLDLHLITDAASANSVPKQSGAVIQWSLFEHLNQLSSQQRRQLFQSLTYRFSDHLPVVSRFYLDERG
jgi:endonuclease/exonuclease/phosphatase family metal-dependent hydrolase